MTLDTNGDITAATLIDAIYDEAQQRLKQDSSLHEDYAYLVATIAVVKRAGRQRRKKRLSPREQQVLGAVKCILQRAKHRRWVERKEVVRELQLSGVTISEWTISRTFADLEALGLLFRETARGKRWFDSPPPRPTEKAA